MKTQHLTIENNGIKIPAILWGEPKERLLLAVHGMQASKDDPVVALAAQCAESKGLCALSFDLPEHGERFDSAAEYPCKPWNGINDLLAVYRYAKTIASEISIFACSLGAYFTMLTLPELEVQQLLFLSPVVSMEHLIEGMMLSAGVSLQQLEREKIIPVPNAPELDWDYTCFVKAHPIKYDIRLPVAILYGENDLLCARADEEDFAKWYDADLTVLPAGEHWFHTPEQLSALSDWLNISMSPVDAKH